MFEPLKTKSNSHGFHLDNILLDVVLYASSEALLHTAISESFTIFAMEKTFLSPSKLFRMTKTFQNEVSSYKGWSGGAMVLGKLPVPGRPTIWITVRQGLTALAVGAGGGCLDIFTLISLFLPLSGPI